MFFEKLMSAIINVITLGFIGFVFRGTHKTMVLSNVSNPCFSTYDRFKRDFQKVDWHFDTKFRHSLFSSDARTECHADIYQINGTGYILTTYGYLRSLLLIKKKIKQLSPEPLTLKTLY